MERNYRIGKPELIVNRGIAGIIQRDGNVLIIPDECTSVGEYALAHFKFLKEVTLPETMTTINDYAFYEDTKLEKINFPSSLSYIGEHAFSDCNSLTEIIFEGEGPRKIGYSAFSDCTYIKRVEFGSRIAEIEDRVFNYCNLCDEYDFSRATSVPKLTPMSSTGTAIFGTNTNTVFKVPSALVDEWKATAFWSDFASRIVAV